MLLIPLSPVTNCHTFSDPSSVTYFMDGPSGLRTTQVENRCIRRRLDDVSGL